MKCLILCVILLTMLLVPGCQRSSSFECTDALGCVTLEPGAPLQLGVIQDLSGGGAVFGVEQRNIFELVVAERQGKLLEHPLEVKTEDELCTAEGGANAALRIKADPKVVAIFGTTCSSAAGAAMQVISDTGLVMISGVNSAPSLTSFGGVPGTDWRPGYFRTMLNVAEEARATAVFVYAQLGITQAATVDDGDTFSRAYKAVFAQKFVELGGKITLEATVNKGDTEMMPVLEAIVAADAPLVFLALFPPEGAALVQQARQMPGMEGRILFGGGSLRTDNFLIAVGAAGLGMYFVGSAPPAQGPANDALVAAYTARFGDAPQTVTYAYGYDAANLLLHTIESVAVQEKNGTLHIGRQALRDALYATRNFDGVTGKISCDAFGDCAVVRFDFLKMTTPARNAQELLSQVIYTYTP